MKFSIVTPCLNARSRIEETVASIAQQAANCASGDVIEHIICDGGSTDGTLELLRRFEGAHLRVDSQPDTGMYQALARGLRQASGDVLAYLNAGDYLHTRALSVVGEVFSSHRDCRWLTGYAVEYNEAGVAVGFQLPYRYRRRLIRCGAYGRFLPFVQQESTFWRRELMARVDLERLAHLRLAGDAYLWRCFAETDELRVVSAYLGGFRRHAGQLSEDRRGYLEELRGLSAAPGWLDWPLIACDKLLWQAPRPLKKAMNPDGLYFFDHDSGRWQ